MAAALAHLGHVSTNHFHNRVSPWGYFITYRAYAGFDVDRVVPNQNVFNAYKTWVHLVPFGKRMEPWYRRKIEPWFQSRIDN